MSETEETVTKGRINNGESLNHTIETIKSGFETHKQDHERLKDHLVQVLEENRHLQQRLQDASRNKDLFLAQSCESCDSQMVDRLRGQIKNLNQEKESFEELWHTSQRTIATLETEVAHYRRQLNQPNSVFAIKQEYLRSLREMEVQVKELNSKLETKRQENETLTKRKLEADAKVSTFEAKLNEILTHKKLIIDKCRQSELALQTARNQITLLTKEKSRIETELQRANTSEHEHRMRKNEAVAKVNEALALAETAIAEKEASLVREKDSREECDYLARTIGQVMEDAAKRVDDEFESMRKEHQSESERLIQVIKKNKMHLDVTCKRLKEAEAKCGDLEEKVAALSKSNMILDSDLQRASQNIVDLELKVQILEKGIKNEHEHNGKLEEKSRKLQEIVDENRKMKVQWKQMTLDVTTKLQNKIKDLYERNRHLQNEKQQLKALIPDEAFS